VRVSGSSNPVSGPEAQPQLFPEHPLLIAINREKTYFFLKMKSIENIDFIAEEINRKKLVFKGQNQ
jgi:hypothetical protein